uniref:Uncharacterized protein n=1 Tax=Arundo donax TaxID=35708 RepID=A0A0A8YXE0_ARUDO
MSQKLEVRVFDSKYAIHALFAWNDALPKLMLTVCVRPHILIRDGFDL